MDIAVIGSNMVDLISYVDRMPEQGETLAAPDFQMGCGGKGANQAVAASRLGSDVLMVTRVGNDIFAKNTIDNFAKNGIDTRFVLETESTSGVAPIFVDKDSNNSIIIVLGANEKLSPADIDAAADEIAACKLIVLQLEVPLETVYAAIEFGNAHDIPVLLNPAPAHPDLDIERVKSCTYFMPNETELALLTSKPVDTIEQIREAAQGLVDQGVKDVIVTMGSRGALWVNSTFTKEIPAVRVEAKDTTGAGDAFIGCFSHYLVKSGDVEKAMAMASKYAADSVTKLGTQSSYATAAEFVGAR
ncbi:ribokinase [Ancrocorticia populi]|uniref:Deoxyribokinase n=1 Tax=Ancrocorticia populi TaxID=2175228 RepID=A0A2V1K6M7_9ACTO|nr:ribokinase [Ancrocorticia populi]MDN6486356.1 ribokinase [Ancrocorticia sp.]PWF27118.1 ribokinase [Ancrocorticia populi]